MIDIVIPYFLINEGLELKYALRSVEKHLFGVGNIFIIGDKPDWLQEAIHIPFKDGNMMAGKERNIYQKVLTAAMDPRVNNYFLYMNDDHFLLRDFEASQFPPYWHNTLSGSLETNKSPYRQTLENTIAALPMGGMECNFDGHCPMVFNRERFVRTFERVDWSIPYGYCMKTMYCVLNGIVGEHMPDLKVSGAPPKGWMQEILMDKGNYFSISDKSLNKVMRDALEELYPLTSKYEK